MVGSSPRPAAEDDLEQVAAIETYSNRPPWTKNAFAAELKKSGSHFWVLTDDETDEKVLAYVVFSFLGEQAHIQTLAVNRSARRRGNGIRLLRFVINFVLRRGGDSIYLELRKSNAAALALYQQVGFVVLRTVKGLYPDGEDAYAMLFRFKAERLTESSEEENDARDEKNIN